MVGQMTENIGKYKNGKRGRKEGKMEQEQLEEMEIGRKRVGEIIKRGR